MFCPRCSTPNPPQARFCFKCGTLLAQAGPVVPTGSVTPPTPLNTNPVAPLADYTPAMPTAPAPGLYNQPAPGPYPTYGPPPAYQPGGSGFYPPAPYGYPAMHPLEADAPVVHYHPLAEGTLGLPIEIQASPQKFYSYVNSDNRLIFARRARFWPRFGAMLLDLMVIALPYFFVAAIIGTATSSSTRNPRTVAQLDATATGWILLVGLTIFLSYFYFTGLRGQSLGQRAAKIKVIRLDGRPPDRLTAFMRYVVGYMFSTNLLAISLVALVVAFLGSELTGGATLLGIACFGWGFWWCAWDELGQGWHDKLARTLVVETNECIEGVHFGREVLG